MRTRVSLVLVAALAAALFATVANPRIPVARADDGSSVYYLALGDSLAAGTQPNDDTSSGYAEQLYASLVGDQPKLRLVKLGCSGESTVSMRFGSQPPTEVASCGGPRYYKNFLYSKGTQLAEAVGFLRAHKGKVALVTIDVGADDLARLDPQGDLVVCLFEPAGCAAQGGAMAENLAAILDRLRAAAGADVPIVGMTYYDTYAPLCVSDPSLKFVCSRVDALNAVLADTYAAKGVPVADVAGAFENDNLVNAATHVCAWTWFCALGDVHPNTTGYGVIAQAFRQAATPIK